MCIIYPQVLQHIKLYTPTPPTIAFKKRLLFRSELLHKGFVTTKQSGELVFYSIYINNVYGMIYKMFKKQRIHV